MMEKLRSSQNEVETAFSMMLPDQRIEVRLKSIVEYMDEYDESTGMIVFGMPKAAIERKGADIVAPSYKIADIIIKKVNEYVRGQDK
ncbi:two-component system, chemotaxis family, response regulator CheB [Caldanaerovirga acetigignens]|uniref:Two-component system, chemotaxis family, response regulator CheB n=2 Tax=Caldanaerovirga acetigignens TaxID=447595 RepID=A0A1M7JUE5_9FIRM|nr:two-component system, chemotaxis family, response regulator CheB [Caldanaerovirga acetigignens]